MMFGSRTSQKLIMVFPFSFGLTLIEENVCWGITSVIMIYINLFTSVLFIYFDLFIYLFIYLFMYSFIHSFIIYQYTELYFKELLLLESASLPTGNGFITPTGVITHSLRTSALKTVHR